MPGRGDVDEAILRRRARKRKNTQAWREKERILLDQLRAEVESLEQRLAAATPRGGKSHGRQEVHTLDAKMEDLVARQRVLEAQNTALEQELQRLRADATTGAAPHTTVSLLNHIQSTHVDLVWHVPVAMERLERDVDMQMVNGWLVKSVAAAPDGDLFLELNKTLVLSSSSSDEDQTPQIAHCRRHWSIVTHADSFRQVYRDATEYQVVSHAHDDLHLVRVAFPSADRDVALFKMQSNAGYDLCVLHFPPDDAAVVTTALVFQFRMKRRQPDGHVMADIHVLGRCRRASAASWDPHQMRLAVAMQCSEWERLQQRTHAPRPRR
ncbi:Aste57867_16436 [Aphanomyces stellatus]|uniref:Aste57867_16436 protein n=1 Tax=Aphanomyces stellatus TaxID=120398 RepID=A0A485L8N4_9STRA|nr:hypothetical protein As57867_016379 [Aphanomyces stellatus]VFT93211.1 Aste57867_16436 [Aphanomyces stellatus]